MSITALRHATPDEWEAAWRGCPYATYFHSREWANLWAAYRGWTPFPWHATFSDGATAVLPFSRERRYRRLRLGYRFVSSPAGTFGGWLSEHPLREEHAALLAEYLTERVPNLYWRLNPYDEIATGIGRAPSRDDFTQALNLEGGFDAVFSGWSKGHRAAARQAMRSGVSIRVAEGQDDWRSFYGVYLSSVERWGEQASSVYDWQLFELLDAANSEHTRLWLAEVEEQVVAGALCLYGGHHVVYWLGAARADHFDRRPVHLLVHEAIKDACDRGLRWFDFNPSGGHDGVVAFKQHFGSIRLPAPVVAGRRRIGPRTRRLPTVHQDGETSRR